MPLSPPIMSLNADVTQMQSSDLEAQNERAKYAGQVIYNSIHGDSVVPPPIPAAPITPAAAAAAAAMEESGIVDGKMSSVRRTFCLFVLFDLILMFILWVIYTQLIGDTGYKAFTRQVKDYSFKTSLFDSVMLSAVRFTLLLLAYALFRIKHWWMIAITTALSCAVLIAKIFLYDFDGPKGGNNPLSYCLIIISFVLAWAETWFLDFKVLPHEKKLEARIALTRGTGYGSTYIGGGSSRPFAYDDMQSVITEDNQFYSPLDTPEDSDAEDNGRGDGERASDYRSVRSSRGGTRQDNDYVRLAKHSWEVLWTYFNSPESEWKKEAGEDIAETGIVHSKKVKGVGKIFRLKGLVEMPAKDLFELLTFTPEEQPQWNSAVKHAKVLQVVDENTDVLHNIASEIAGGVITSRDFVSLRTWGSKDGIYMGSGMGVKHPDMPPQKAYIRGENGCGGWVYEPDPEDESRCIFHWYMNTDIKGWFPQKLIDANMAKVLLDFIKDVKNHVKNVSGAAS